MKVTLGLVQMKMGKDSEKNLERALSMAAKAADQGANVICLPELFDHKYFPQNKNSTVEPETFPNDTTQMLSAAARDAKAVIVAGSLYEKSGSKAYNTSFVFDHSGKLLGKYRKVHLPEDRDFYEQNYFTSGDSYRVFRTRFGNIGVLICFDQWYSEPARALKLMGADMVLYPTAIGTVSGVEQDEGDWREAWEAVQRGHAIANSLVVAAINRMGVEKDLAFWGGSFVYDQFGKLIARADEREQVVLATVDLDLSRKVEDGWGFIRNRKPGTYSRLVK